jgi:hypothetical protein
MFQTSMVSGATLKPYFQCKPLTSAQSGASWKPSSPARWFDWKTPPSARANEVRKAVLRNPSRAGRRGGE